MKRGASISQQVLGIFAVFAVLSLTMPGNARAEELKYTLTDPAGDHTGDIDVTMLEFLFDNATGEYEITLRATVPNPFLGVFRVRIALFNPDTGSQTQNPSFFQVERDFSLGIPPTMTLPISGNDARLRSWKNGDRVAPSSIPFGVPSDVQFDSFFTELLEDPFGQGGVDQIAEKQFGVVELADSSQPSISNLSLDTLTAGAAAPDVTVVGSNFTPDSTVLWNGVERPTTFISSKQLRARLSASDLDASGSGNVSVFNPQGASSNASSVQINNPAPEINCFSPPFGVVGGDSFTLSIFGSNFVRASSVSWDGQDRETTFVSGNELTVGVTSNDLGRETIVFLNVSNPQPGGGISPTGDLPIISVDPAAPTVSSLDPSSIFAGDPGLTLRVNGSGFVAGSVVLFNGRDRETTFINGAQLQAEILAVDIADGCVVPVTVRNPSTEVQERLAAGLDPGETFNNGSGGVFTVLNPLPVLVDITPSSSKAGSPMFDLAANGVGFVPSSKVQWNGGDRVTDFLDPTEVEAEMPVFDVMTEGTGSVAVTSPGPGGGTSTSQTFTITTTMPPATTLYYPRLVSTDGVATGLDSSQTTGIAVANLGGSDASLIMTALDKVGSEISGQDITNPAALIMPALEQVPIVDNQVFGAGIRARKPDGWMKVESTVAELIGFFLTFNDSLTFLDGADVSSNTLTSFVLPEIEDEGFTEIHAANPGLVAANITFELYRSDGVLRTGSVMRNVGPDGTVTELFSEMFAGVTPVGSDYILASSDQPVVAFEFLGKTGIYVEGLNGQDATAGATVLYSPQYVIGGPDWRTTMSVVNLDAFGGMVAFQFIRDDGTQIGPTRMTPIVAKGKIQVTDQAFFVDAGDVLTQGYVKITSDGPRLAGGVVFGDPGRSIFSSALPLVSTLQTAVIFGQVASNTTFFTGVAIINPNGMAVSALIEVFDRNGSLVVSKNEMIPAGQRRSLLLTQYFLSLVGEDISSGYIRVTIDKGVASFALFGTNDLSVLSAVPPQLVP